MMWVILFLALIGFLLFRLGWTEVKRRDEKQLRINEKLKQIGFIPTRIFVDERKNSAIAFDKDRSKFAIVNIINNEIKLCQFDSIDIIQSEIVEDNISVSRSSRTSQVGGALVGAALTGGVGAIIGGLSGKRIEKKEIKSLQLKMVINDVEEPVKTIKFLDRESPIEKKNPIYQHYFNEIDHWHNMIKVLLKQSNQLNSN
jgi:hypothetical protein